MRNIKIIILLVAAALGVAAAPASAGKIDASRDTVTAREAFLNLPLKNLEIISRSTRMDMLDYYDTDSIWKAPNSMEGLSYLTRVTPDYLYVQITPVSSLAIRILRGKKDDIVMCVYTINADGHSADSQVSFLDSSMKELDAEKYFRNPELKDYFIFPDKETRDRVLELIPFPTVEFTTGPESADLVGTLTVGEYMTVEDFDRIKTYLKPEIKLKWTGKKYELVK